MRSRSAPCSKRTVITEVPKLQCPRTGGKIHPAYAIGRNGGRSRSRSSEAGFVNYFLRRAGNSNARSSTGPGLQLNRPHAGRDLGPMGRGGDAEARRNGRIPPRTRSGVKVLKFEINYLGCGIATVHDQSTDHRIGLLRRSSQSQGQTTLK